MEFAWVAWQHSYHHPHMLYRACADDDMMSSHFFDFFPFIFA
jgi:hypothetical protein